MVSTEVDSRAAKGRLAAPLRWGYGAYRASIERVRRSPALFRLLFGFNVLPDCIATGGWDWTTLVLCSVLRRSCTPATVLLDVGTGPSAVLACYAALRLGCREVWASDCLPWVIDAARRQVDKVHAATVQCACGDLFDATDRRFDLVVFNAPYLTRQRSENLGLLSGIWARERFDGGPDGCSTIRRFLALLPGHLAEGGIAALGVNTFHVSRPRVEELISRSDLRCVGTARAPFVRSRAYLLTRRGK